MVDAALTGLDLGEAVTMPSLEDIRFLAEYDSAHINLLTASKTRKPASRYRQRIAMPPRAQTFSARACNASACG